MGSFSSNLPENVLRSSWKQIKEGRQPMKHKRFFHILGMVLIFMLTTPLCFADYKPSGRKYEVTITNLTRSQIFSPPIVISHGRHFRLFTLGDTASPELAALAEDGLTDPLINSIADLPAVHDIVVAAGPVIPGNSVTLEISTRRGFNFISVAGMLVITNDAFFAIQGLRIRSWGTVTANAKAYDAGSEANSEDCDYIPGPPCGTNAHDITPSEGYVHIHAGIHGIADLDPAEHDWRNPVAEITIRPIDR
jgi:hypothetical protein